MPDLEHVELLRQGPEPWNAWRAAHPEVRPDLRGLNFESDVWNKRGLYDLPHLEMYDFSGAWLQQVSARNSYFHLCSFDGASMSFSDFCFSTFDGCSFRDTEMRVTKIGSARFFECRFEEADLAYCSAEEVDFSGSQFTDCALDHMSLVKSNLSGTRLERVFVYGTSAWDLNLTGAVQRDVFLDEDMSLRIDDIEVAQFIHLLVRNAKLRDVIDTITSRVVLILGRFGRERKAVLESIREELASRGYVPVLFDFQKPRSRDLTETVSTLAHLARFIVVDLSDPRSVPHELASIIPSLPSVPVQPLIAEGQQPYGMFEHWERFPWVQQLIRYEPRALHGLGEQVALICEAAIQRQGDAG